MAKAINISCVEPFVVDEGDRTNLHKRFITWKEELEIYLVAAGVTDKRQKQAVLLHLGGNDIRDIYKPIKEEEDTFEIICKKLDDYFKPRKNLLYERYKFKQAKQNHDESTPAYVTRLKNLALTFEFENANIEI